MTINWNDNFSVEDPVIDEDHKTLINYFNKFEWATEGNPDFKVLEHIFSDLRKCAVEHFQREDILMAAVNYPGFDEHKKSHHDIVVKLDEMLKNLHSASREKLDGGKIVRDMAAIINNWLNHHLIGEDQLYKPYVVKHRTYENKGNQASDERSDGRRDRRSAAAASSGDRRGAAPHSKAWRIVLIVAFVLVGVVAGGAYWIFGDVGNSPPTKIAEPAKNKKSVKVPVSVKARPARPAKNKKSVKVLSPVKARPLGLGWVAKSKCKKFPKAKWWHDASHMKTAIYVATKSSGNWKSYAKKWSRQLKKLRKWRDNGTVVVAPGGKRLKGKYLDAYISKVSERVDVIKCMADEVAADAAR